MAEAAQQMVGVLKVRVVKGVRLAVRDFSSSDPYVVLSLAGHQMRTDVVYDNLNPEWGETFDFPVFEGCPDVMRLEVKDKNCIMPDKAMGHAEFEINHFIQAARREHNRHNHHVLKELHPHRDNCLAEVSKIMWSGGSVSQYLVLRLREVESGEVEIELKWSRK